jgi:hypothetical protein
LTTLFGLRIPLLKPRIAIAKSSSRIQGQLIALRQIARPGYLC